MPARLMKNTSSPAFPILGNVVHVEEPVDQRCFDDGETRSKLEAQIRKRERKFIGQELHDNVNQLLGAAKMMLEMQSPMIARDEELRKRSLTLVTQAINEIRELSTELVSKGNAMEGLKKSVQELISDLQFPGTITVKFEFDERLGTIKDQSSLTLYRIAQEHLKNVALHSQAKHVEILIQPTRDKKIMMIIKDDGKGFDPLKIKRGIGLSNISDRASSQGGTASIQSSPGKGCILLVTVPSVIN